MNVLNEYHLWCDYATEDPDILEELKEINGDDLAIEDRFYKDLEFGTGGLRGVIGAGTNRINIYTVRKASQGLANYLKKNYRHPSIAIAFDSRIKSDLFAENSASVFAANGIKVYIYSTLMPTPALSFAVRDLECSAGIVITASHNPAKYNGYKVYGSDGCQITLDMANSVLDEIQSVDIFDDIIYHDFNALVKSKEIEYISESTIKRYLSAVSSQSINKDLISKNNLNIIYTPLNGAGLYSVMTVLNENGFTNIKVVPEQEFCDGNFPTCPYPNPEIEEALAVGLELCKKENADILLATDPDCDRVGIAIKHRNDYILLNGNQVGILLFDFICKNRIQNHKMPKNPIVIKTIVTTDMVIPLAKKYGVEVIDVLTGFKFIGEQIGFLEQKGEEYRYIFGFEESYGYLSGTYVRDKDAVNASLLICEMAAYYKATDRTLMDALEDLYQTYGYYVTSLSTFDFDGISGFKKMQTIMTTLREGFIKSIDNKKVIEKYDYQLSIKYDYDGNQENIELPKSNVIKLILDDNSSVVVRPSGTEPKLKIYYSSQGKSKDDANKNIQNLQSYFCEFINE